MTTKSVPTLGIFSPLFWAIATFGISLFAVIVTVLTPFIFDYVSQPPERLQYHYAVGPIVPSEAGNQATAYIEIENTGRRRLSDVVISLSDEIVVSHYSVQNLGVDYSLDGVGEEFAIRIQYLLPGESVDIYVNIVTSLPELDGSIFVRSAEARGAIASAATDEENTIVQIISGVLSVLLAGIVISIRVGLRIHDRNWILTLIGAKSLSWKVIGLLYSRTEMTFRAFSELILMAVSQQNGDKIKRAIFAHESLFLVHRIQRDSREIITTNYLYLCREANLPDRLGDLDRIRKKISDDAELKIVIDAIFDGKSSEEILEMFE